MTRRTFDPQHVYNPLDWFFFHVGRDMRHQREVLNKSARLAFGGVTRAQHTPLTRLQRTGTGHFASLFKLRANTGHHTQRRNKT